MSGDFLTMNTEDKPSYKDSRIGKIANRLRQLSNIRRASPAQVGQFRQRRAMILRTLGARTARPQGRIKVGRGRPRGSFKYFIPGKGPVDVFTWRRYIRQQRNLVNGVIQRRAVVQDAIRQGLQNQPQQNIQYRQPQTAQALAQQYQQMRPVMGVETSLREVSALDRTGINPGPEPQQNFVELDLVSGLPKQRRLGNLW